MNINNRVKTFLKYKTVSTNHKGREQGYHG